jgi:hypothetical protein
MAGNARFHNKWHRRNHHSLPSQGYPDSGTDPIASPEEPFYGDFVVYNSISAHENLFIDGDATIQGSLSVYGNLTYLETIVSVTSALSVVNHGTGPALTVMQYGAEPVARFIDADADGGPKTALFIDDNGYIVTGGATPAVKYTSDSGGNKIMDVTFNGDAYSTKGMIWETPDANTVYVSTTGSDSNTGLNRSQKVRTIKKAAQIVFDRYGPNKATIIVESGNYYEDNPIYIVAGTSLIGEGFLRRVNLYSNNRPFDYFWLNTACYMWGFTFRNMIEPAAATAFPVLLSATPAYQVAFNTPGYEISTTRGGGPFGLKLVSPPYVTTSPYTQGCSSITNYLTSTPTLQTAYAQATDLSKVNGLSAIADIDATFNTIKRIIIGGPGDYTAYAHTPLPGSTDAADLIDLNINFIASEVVAYVNAAFPFLVYNQNTCRRDLVTYILPGISSDLRSGTNTRSIENGIGYWDGIGGRYIPANQVAATCGALDYAKHLCKYVSVNAPPPIPGGGTGIRVDGSHALGFLRSFVTDSFTQFNQGGKGVHILNAGYAQLVSTFTICTTEGVFCESGGQCSISTSNCSFGLSGLVATGKTEFPVLTGYMYRTTGKTENAMYITGVTPKPLSSFVAAIQAGFSLSGIPIETPYDGLLIKAFDDPASRINPDLNPTGETYYHSIIAVSALKYPGDDPYSYRITLTKNTLLPLTATPAEPRYVEFYLRSLIASSSHAFEYIGTGTELAKAVPALGGIPINANEAVYSDNGIVYYSSTNEKGDFKVGSGFTIVQSKGSVVGLSFDKSILSLVTPLILSLE